MKIAYVTNYDSSDVHAWSGIGSYMATALEGTGAEVVRVGGLRERRTVWMGIKKVLYKIQGKRYLRDRDPLVLKSYAREVEAILEAGNFDIVFSPGSLVLAYLETDLPMVFWTDATFAGMIDFYPEFSSLCNETLKDGNRAEQLALDSSNKVIFSSKWAADSAQSFYHTPSSKLNVIPFGANMDGSTQNFELEEVLKLRSQVRFKLLFIGVDWKRKGGELVLAIVEELVSRGFSIQLNVVGCSPPERDYPEYIKLHGFVSKSSEEGRAKLDQIFLKSHFLIVPSVAECAGAVYAEASSYGLPSIGTKVGGISSMIHDGVNGQTFELDVRPSNYADYIAAHLNDRTQYEEFCRSTLKDFKNRLSWDVNGKQAMNVLQEALAGEVSV